MRLVRLYSPLHQLHFVFLYSLVDPVLLSYDLRSNTGFGQSPTLPSISDTFDQPLNIPA